MGMMQNQARASMASRFPTPTTFTTLLFLLLTTRTLAQETAPSTLQTITTTAGNAATSLATSAFSATPTSEALSTGFPSATTDISLPSPTSTNNQNTRTNGGFNYYFVIIAGAVVCFLLFFVFMARRRKAQALLIHAHTQRALAEDTAGYRSPRYGRGWGPSDNGHGNHTISSRVRMMGRRREEVPEGLNEAGEAPPPYMPGSKPPSLRSDDGDLEMDEMRRPVPKPKHGELPPGYGLEHGGESSEVVARPETAVVRP